MCQGVPIFANNKKALYGKGTNSHSTSAGKLRIDEDKYRKFEYLWWEKKLINAHYDQTAEDILKKINPDKADSLAKTLVKKEFNTDIKLAKWLKGVPDEWDKLLEPKFEKLAKKVNPKLIYYSKKIKSFKYSDKKFNPYQATKLPTLNQLKKQKGLTHVRDQVGAQVWAQVWAPFSAQLYFHF